jgi:LuxR family transcriptional regulator, maltose regulon positive regulatory protein
VARVSPERSDKDPAGFLSHLTGALWEVEESFGEDVLAALDFPQHPPVEAPVGAIVNGLDETRTEVVLVLDVYRVVDSGLVHDTVVLLLRHLPENTPGDLRERSSLCASRVLTCKSSENKEPTSGLEPLTSSHYECAVIGC